MSNHGLETRVCKHRTEIGFGSEAADCDTLNLGLVLNQLSGLRDPSDTAAPDRRSVQDILRCIRRIKGLKSLPMLTDAFVKRHGPTCSIGRVILGEVETIINNFEGLRFEFVTSQPASRSPHWLCVYLTELQSRYPNDLWEAMIPYPATSPIDAMESRVGYYGVHSFDGSFAGSEASLFPRIKCLDCPGILYPTKAPYDCDKFEAHLESGLHKQRVKERLAKDHRTQPETKAD